MKPDPKLKSVYRASFNAKIAKTISLAHLGPRATAAFRDALPAAFRAEQPFAVYGFLHKCSTASRISCEPSMEVIRKHWAARAERDRVDLSGCRSYEEAATALGIAKLKILATPGCMDEAKDAHFQEWMKELYKDLFPVKARAKKLSANLYQKKHEFLMRHEPKCYHRLPSGDVRPYFQVRGWEFHGDVCNPPTDAEVKDIPDFQHLDLSPIEAAYTRDPWEDVMELVGWDRRSLLGERFFVAAHDDFHDWLQAKNAMNGERQNATSEGKEVL